jgi:hypothetical protein
LHVVPFVQQMPPQHTFGLVHPESVLLSALGATPHVPAVQAACWQVPAEEGQAPQSAPRVPQAEVL